MVFLWFSYGFPMVFLGSIYIQQVLLVPFGQGAEESTIAQGIRQLPEVWRRKNHAPMDR